ncbi:MAG TPA: DUF6134 family protein [Gemmataceae bacterium]|jgi:hypothetical protein|nr:DUF6134 family protein [Gemmataceae bacterium]
MSVRRTPLIAGICLTCLNVAATAADSETRVFTVQVDGKSAGEFRLTVRTADDGAETATASASVHVKSLLGGYRYSYRGTEVWSAGRLRQFDASSDDNGTRHVVRAVAEGDKVRVTVDGAGRLMRPDVLPTTYWRMPTAKAGRSVALLDADTGEGQMATITVGPQTIRVAGKETSCTRIGVAAPVPATIWYDARGRMVLQETIEDGHKTVLTLREMQR